MFLSKNKMTTKNLNEINILKTLAALDQSHEAVNYASELLKKFPDDEQIYFYRGLALENDGNVQLAMEQYKKALDINKNYGKALVHLGQIYLQRTDVDNAKEYLKRASKIIKKDPAVFHSLGLAAQARTLR